MERLLSETLAITFRVPESVINKALALETENAQLRAMAEYLAKETVGRQCELTCDRGYRRCPDPAVAVRWEDGFADDVCEKHAQSALDRGRAIVIRPVGVPA